MVRLKGAGQSGHLQNEGYPSADMKEKLSLIEKFLLLVVKAAPHNEPSKLGSL